MTAPSWQRVANRLEQYVSAGRVNEYYETVFAEMVAADNLSFEAVFFDNKCWYEIDTLEDLREAEKLFPTSGKRQAFLGVAASGSRVFVTKPRRLDGWRQ